MPPPPLGFLGLKDICVLFGFDSVSCPCLDNFLKQDSQHFRIPKLIQYLNEPMVTESIVLQFHLPQSIDSIKKQNNCAK